MTSQLGQTNSSHRVQAVTGKPLSVSQSIGGPSASLQSCMSEIPAGCSHQNGSQFQQEAGKGQVTESQWWRLVSSISG